MRARWRFYIPYLLISIPLVSFIVWLFAMTGHWPMRNLQRQLNDAYGIDPSAPAPPDTCPDQTFVVARGYRSLMARAGGRLDESGVVMRFYGITNEWGAIGYDYSPVIVAWTASEALQEWCRDGDTLGWAVAQRHAAWLINRAVWRGDAAVWLYSMPDHVYGLDPGWSDAMTQGAVAVFFTQLYSITGEEQYAGIARAAIRPFAVDMDDGGVRVEVDGGAVYQLLAQPGATPTHVLNGHLVALEALAYVGDHLPMPEALEYFEDGVKPLPDLLPQYDLPGGMGHSLFNERVVNPNGYQHRIVVQELEWLYERTGDPVYREYADLWTSRQAVGQ